jgi:sec-independent protein translocase protein TatA
MDFRGGRAQNVGFRNAIGPAFPGEEFMGLAMSVPQLLIILVIVALIFGTKRLKEVGGDLGSAIKSFKKAMATEEHEEPPHDQKQLSGTAGQQTEKREQSERQQS